MTVNRTRFESVDTSTSTAVLVVQYLTYITPQYAITTVNNRRSILQKIIRELPTQDVTKLTIFDIEVYLAEKAKVDEPTSISTKRSILRSFFQYCQEYREINLAFQWDAIKRKKVKAPRKKTFTREEITLVLDNCPSRQDKLMIAILFYTGVRISELLNITLEDIRGTQIQVRGKGSYDRVVHMPLWLRQEIREYTALRLYSDGYLFRPLQQHKTHPSNRYITDKTVRHRLKRVFRNVLGKEMHPHQLRHSFAVDWLMRGGDLRTLQIMLGHDSIETTQVYLGLTDNQTGDIYARVFAT
jgi:site-specific recombinase XerD